MITFEKKTDPQPDYDKSEENRFEQIRQAALKMHKKSDTRVPTASAKRLKTTR